MKGRTQLGVVLRVMAIMGVVELAIMVFIEFGLPREIRHLGVFIDPFLLVVLGAPLVAWWVVRPYERAHDKAVAAANLVATRDPLTRLPNRRVFTDYLDRSLAGVRRRHHFSAVLTLDLDGFREINETFGPEGGDTVLAGVAGHIAEHMRGEDLVCRLGGDEFAFALIDLGADRREAERSANDVADKLRQAVRQPIPFDNSLLQVDASFGVRVFGSEVLSAEHALRDAGVAMAQAKAAGRGCVVAVGVGGQPAFASPAAMLAEVERDHGEIDRCIDELLASANHRLPALHSLAARVSAHFGYEDEVLDRMHVAGAPAHHHTHAELAAQVQRMVTAATEDSAAEVAQEIRALVHRHIADFDSKIGAAAPAPGAG